MSEQTIFKAYRYDGPIFGSFGSLSFVGERLVCHVCGRDYLQLATHARLMHGLTGPQYKATFGLFRRTPLMARSICQKSRERAIRIDLAHLGTDHSPEHMASIRKKAIEVVTSDRRAERRPTNPYCPQGHLWDGLVMGKKRPQRVCRICNRRKVAAARAKRLAY